jgi:hypothetical protein
VVISHRTPRRADQLVGEGVQRGGGRLFPAQLPPEQRAQGDVQQQEHVDVQGDVAAGGRGSSTAASAAGRAGR